MWITECNAPYHIWKHTASPRQDSGNNTTARIKVTPPFFAYTFGRCYANLPTRWCRVVGYVWMRRLFSYDPFKVNICNQTSQKDSPDPTGHLYWCHVSITMFVSVYHPIVKKQVLWSIVGVKKGSSGQVMTSSKWSRYGVHSAGALVESDTTGRTALNLKLLYCWTHFGSGKSSVACIVL